MPASTTTPRPGSRDRSRRLALFGVLGIVVGAGAFVLALVNLALPFLHRWLPASGGPPPDGRTALAGALTWALVGALFVWGGVGSVRCRAWARSVMLMLGWTWLLAGAVLLILGWWMADDVLALAAARSVRPLPDGVAGIVKAVILGGLAVGGVVLPALFVWAYSGREVLRTCAARNPEPDWSAACPPAVLGLSLGLGACGLLGLPTAFHAVVPLFGRIVTGVPALVLVLAGTGVCLWLARATYRLEPAGWWATLAFLVLTGATVVVTFSVVDVREFLLAYGLPPEQAAGMDGLEPALVWGSVLLTLASVGYLLAVRHHFAPGDGRAAGPQS